MSLIDDFDNSPSVKALYAFLQSLGAYMRIVLDTKDTFMATGHSVITELDDWYTITVRVKRLRSDAE